MKRFLLCLVLLATPAQAQAPPVPPVTPPVLSITGSTTVMENTLCELSLSGSVSSVAWLVMPDVSQYANGQALVFTGPPGPYSVIALAVSAGQPVILKTVATIQPGAQSTLAIAIFDPQTLTSLPAGQVGVYQSTTIESTLAAQGVTWLQYDINDTIPTKSGSSPVASTTWGTKALAVGLPALVTSNAGAVTAIPLPQDVPTVVGQYSVLKGSK